MPFGIRKFDDAVTVDAVTVGTVDFLLPEDVHEKDHEDEVDEVRSLDPDRP